MKLHPTVALSCICSGLLIPVAMTLGEQGLFVLVAVNFILFHSIWISRCLSGPSLPFADDFFVRELRLPLALFMIFGLSAFVLAV